MKRSLALLLMLLLLLPFSACTSKEELVFTRKGIYNVSLDGSDISFRALLDGEYREFVFTSPESIAGLSAVSYDGVTYSMEYCGLQFVANEAAIKAATDFAAATELLEKAGNASGARIYASVDGISAEGLFTDGKLTDLAFTDGRDGRNYKIQTEATG